MNYESRVEPAIEAAPASEPTGDDSSDYLPVGKSTALPKRCQEFAQGSLGGEGGRVSERESGRHRAFLFSLAPSLSVAELRMIVFGGSFAEFDRLPAALAGAGFVRFDIADVAKIVEVIQFAVAPGLKFDDLDEVCAGEDSGANLEIALADALVHPDGGGCVNRQEGIEFALRRLQRVDVSARFAIGSDLIEFLQLFSDTCH